MTLPAKVDRYKHRKQRRETAMATPDPITGELKLWQKSLALWVISQAGKVSRAAIHAQAMRLAPNISKRSVERLVSHETFKRFVTEAERDAAARARAVMEAHIIDGVITHYTSMKALAERGEHKEVAKFSSAYINRAWPTSGEAAGGPPTLIQVNIGGGWEPETAPVVQAEEVIVEEPKVVG